MSRKASWRIRRTREKLVKAQAQLASALVHHHEIQNPPFNTWHFESSMKKIEKLEGLVAKYTERLKHVK